ncbi:hypothetical protein QBZ16_002973 [Prototheca wickerhamii]|uniref:RRM domain-containing protein n=1 Tax=Prototheca wickerhamii TaxID=3111 RepID=A0AAD9IMZ3_PROWI|nr:hypothetical protein QBZ16_002973 [Prototheca wickerhamii]
MAPKKEKAAPAAEQPSTSESPMKYFSQFGEVTRLRLSRNKKTGKSKHYAFVEFKSTEVARIVAEAMDGYMFFKQRLQARVMLKSQVHKDLMKGANREFKTIDWRKREMERHNAEKTPQKERMSLRRALKRDAQRQQKIKEAGIEYEYKGLAASIPAKPTKTVFSDDA